MKPDLGNIIRIGRAKKGWSQDDLAAFLGVHKQSVSRWEGGRAVPDGNTLVQIIKALDLTADLFEHSPQPVSPYISREEFNQVMIRLDRLEKTMSM